MSSGHVLGVVVNNSRTCSSRHVTNGGALGKVDKNRGVGCVVGRNQS